MLRRVPARISGMVPPLATAPPRVRARPGAGGAAMSLSAREQQALDSIKSGLAGSDPELAALLSAFTRLASGEEMPDRERSGTLAMGFAAAPAAPGGAPACAAVAAPGFPAGRAAAVVGADNGRAHSGRGDPQYRRRSRYVHRNGGDGLRRAGSGHGPASPSQRNCRPGAPAAGSRHPTSRPVGAPRIHQRQGWLRERASPPVTAAVFERPGAGAWLVARACAMKVAQEQAEGLARNRASANGPCSAGKARAR